MTRTYINEIRGGFLKSFHRDVRCESWRVEKKLEDAYQQIVTAGERAWSTNLLALDDAINGMGDDWINPGLDVPRKRRDLYSILYSSNLFASLLKDIVNVSSGVYHFFSHRVLKEKFDENCYLSILHIKDDITLISQT